MIHCLSLLVGFLLVLLLVSSSNLPCGLWRKLALLNNLKKYEKRARSLLKQQNIHFLSLLVSLLLVLLLGSSSSLPTGLWRKLALLDQSLL